MSWASVEVSVVSDAFGTQTKSYTLAKLLGAIKGGKWASQVAALRALVDKDAIREAKEKLPGIMFSGRFSERTSPVLNFLEKASGILALDADNCSKPVELREKLTSDPHVVFAFLSPSGRGLKVGVRIKADADLHKASWAAARKYFEETYNVKIDELCKDISRLCFASDDPDMFIREGEAEILEPLKPAADQYSEDAPEPIQRVHARVQADRKSGLITQVGRSEYVNMTYAAQYFTERRRIKYEPGEGAFYLYDPASGAWRYLFEAEVGKLLKEFWTELMEEFNNPFCLVKKDPLTGTLLNDIKSFCVQPEMFKPKEEAIVHCTNGMVHISADGSTIIRPFSWKYFSRNPIPFVFDPNAEAPQFLAFLREALEEDDVSLFIRYMGNVLIGGNRAEKICFLVGEPESGKTTSVKFIQALIGKGNYTQLRISELAGRFEASSFVGKMLLSAYDARADVLETKEAQMLKMLSGHDEIFAELKYQTKRLPVSPGYALTVTSNEKLRIRLEGTDDVGAWRRRLMIIEFRKKPVSMRDRNLLDRLLREEGDGILMLAIRGAIEHLRELKEHGTFVQTPRQIARVEHLLEESESVKVFVRDALEHDDQVPGMTTNEVVTAYEDFCEARDWNGRAVHQVEKELRDLMMEFHREPLNKHFNNDKARGYRHIKVKNYGA